MLTPYIRLGISNAVMDPSLSSSGIEPFTSLSCETNNTDESKVLEQPTISTLPLEVLEMILMNCSYAEISEKRQVCKSFNEVCQSLLNRGLVQVMHYRKQYSLKLKALLPRRESERRDHALARHWDILSTIEMQMSLLSMTYSEYIDLRVCCFIPGKVLDEAYYVMRYLKSTESPPPVHELLREFRDISLMARDHFNENIVPGLKKSLLLQKTASQSYISAGEECKAKWETNTIGDVSTYLKPYKQQLHFLQPSVMISNKADVNFDVSLNLEPQVPQRNGKRKISTPRNNNEKSGRFDTSENALGVEIETEAQSNASSACADEMFLLSFLPTLKRLNNKQKAEAKLKINQVLFEIEFPSEE
ncbi:uncharacterized protein LOC117120128 [Anneissia japonica]|uniref:uncharacterized protein LOC117120128 n=1 Tax=Anneissia japonica TaxID=1529436 RepID=UPI0014254E34|nr:uncharacterized protein LOC117120128 [Anneissia japonica]